MLQHALLETLMDKAWPACEQEDTGKWVLRASEGVTQRANSVWPRTPYGDADDMKDISAAVRSASDWYRRRRLPLIFQMFDDPRSAALNAVLDRERFTTQSQTRIMLRNPTGLPTNAGSQCVELSLKPSVEWLRLWWSVDGRGGEPELEVACRILTGCESLYALVRDDDGAPAAVGRLALVGGWGGIYCMATSAGHRRLGYGAQVLAALLNEGADRGLEGFWLLVTAANTGARALYSGAGFTDHGGYSYRQAPLKRAPGGC